MGNAQTIVTVTAARALPSYAAVVAVTTAYTESRLHNTTVQTDHDSEGLFQQRVSIYTKPVADDPVRATNAFLDRLTRIPHWQSTPAAVDAQTVQISQYPDRYPPNQPARRRAHRPALARSHRRGSTATPTPTDGAHPERGDGAGHRVRRGRRQPVRRRARQRGGRRTDHPARAGDHRQRRRPCAVTFALAQLGKPYVFGAAGPDAFDCSGLTMAAWAAAGVALPHLAAAQAGDGTAEPTDLSHAGSGDLVFIPGSDGTPAAPGHVGMIVGRGGDGHLYLIQAPGWQNLPIEITDTSQWAGDIVGIRHIA